jgi:DNA-binding response OmpR family regulator
MKQTILVADDDSQIRQILRLYLENAGFTVLDAENGVTALLLFQQSHPDLVILDIMMPVLDGLETARQIRKLAAIPIILLTARVEDDDKLSGFETGADDYVTKPFSPGEVVARVQAILRRTAQPPTTTAAADTPALSFGALSIDAAARAVKIGAEEIELTAREFDLLHTLASHPGHIYTRESLLSALWGYGAEADTRTVDVHVQRLRTKLRNDAASDWNLTTVWGVGYRFDSEKKAETESC